MRNLILEHIFRLVIIQTKIHAKNTVSLRNVQFLGGLWIDNVIKPLEGSGLNWHESGGVGVTRKRS